jgi:hypothetical protein
MEDRLRLLSERVDQSVRQPQKRNDGSTFMLRDLAVEIVRGTPQHGTASEIEQLKRVFWWARNNVEYRQDPRDFDYYQSAGKTISSGAGDCDCHTILVGGLCVCLGYTAGCRVVSPDGQSWHVYSIVGVRTFSNPTTVVALDTTQPGSTPGWEPDMRYRQFELQVTFLAHGGLSPIKKNRWNGSTP